MKLPKLAESNYVTIHLKFADPEVKHGGYVVSAGNLKAYPISARYGEIGGLRFFTSDNESVQELASATRPENVTSELRLKPIKVISSSFNPKSRQQNLALQFSLFSTDLKQAFYDDASDYQDD